MHQQLFHSHEARILFHPASRTLELELRSFSSSASFRRVLRHAIELAAEHSARQWLGHNEHLRMISAEDQEWVHQTCLPQFARLGIQRMANVIPGDAAVREIVNTIVQEAAPGSLPRHVREFFSRDAALEWLAQPLPVAVTT